MKNLWGAFKAGVIVFYVYTFIKMHTHPKWWWVFWLNTICAIYMKMDYDANGGIEGWPK